MDIAIIGAGASGLMLGNILNKYNIPFDIFNAGKIGRKILLSGNSKCNISNEILNEDSYHNNYQALNIVKAYQNKLFNLFNDLHIYTKVSDEGRMYPISEASESVLNILLKKTKNNIIEQEVKDIKKINDKYYINDLKKPYDYIIISIGSPASMPKIFNNSFIKMNGVIFNEFKPSLIGFKSNKDFSSIKGVRMKCVASLYKNKKLIHKEKGEVMFKEDGISGICIMNLSSFYNDLKDKNNTYVHFDLLPGKSYDDLESILPPRLFNYVIKNNIDIHNFIVEIKDTYDFEYAQVCHGGVSLKCLNDDLSLKEDNHIYFTGEVIDVDGICGGYNLMFSFITSIIVGESIHELFIK